MNVFFAMLIIFSYFALIIKINLLNKEKNFYLKIKDVLIALVHILYLIVNLQKGERFASKNITHLYT